ncbi:MAG TPA: response regulator transcription factor [Planctomycetota bacterium]|jgi:two-component system phosphate regulon response regulator PhoB|nr:response regulator transcription factor [Planctomycetota bacterium]
MPEPVVLTVDPDQTVLSFFRGVVTGSGRLFCGARRGEDARRKAREARPAAVVARVSLGDMSGAELVARLREDAESLGLPPVPVLLTALRGQEAEAAAALERGAISVLFFPFDEAELGERLEALLRWAGRGPGGGVVTVGPVTVDLERGEVLRPQPQPLTASEREILRWLLSPPGRTVTRRQIPVEGTERAVDVHVAALRSKLGPAGGLIETIRGIGYRFRGAACL